MLGDPPSCRGLLWVWRGVMSVGDRGGQTWEGTEIKPSNLGGSKPERTESHSKTLSSQQTVSLIIPRSRVAWTNERAGRVGVWSL